MIVLHASLDLEIPTEYSDIPPKSGPVSPAEFRRTLQKFLTHQMPRLTARTIPWSEMGGRKVPKTENKSVLALHAFFKKIVDASGENAHGTLRKIIKRLATSRRVRQPVKVSKIIETIGSTNKVAVVVAKVLDDERLPIIPKIHVVAFQWSKSVQKKIEQAGGSISTLDCFIKVAGTMENIVLVKGDPDARKASKFFGPAPGERGSATYPRCNIKGKNGEKRINFRKPVTYDEDSD